MNGYYNNNVGAPIYTPNGQVPNQALAPQIPQEDEYMEQILKKTESVKMRVFMTFPGSNEWRDKVFDGILEASGQDFLLLNNPLNNGWFLLPKIYIDYIAFDEDIKQYIRKS